MKNENEMIDSLIEHMGKNIVAAIEKRAANNKDKRIEFVRRTLSSEVKNGIVIAMNNEDGSNPEHVVIAKGETSDVVSMMTAAMIYLLKKVGVSLDEYARYLQFVVSFAKKERTGEMTQGANQRNNMTNDNYKNERDAVDDTPEGVVDENEKRLEQEAIRRQKTKANRIFVDILMDGMKGDMK